MGPARTLFGIALALLVCGNLLAQPAPQTGRIPTVTRLVKVFSELEAALQTQARSSDPAALDRSVDPSFEMRDGGAPGTPVPRDDWMRQARATAAPGRSIGQMAVHDLGAYALVSFREVETGTPPGSGHDRFIVDCWKRDGDSWKLAVRYTSAVGASSPERRPTPKKVDKRY
jgi:hypothetical protein